MKQKGKLFLNIATIALCLCAIAVGVYSAKTASLNVGGTVGFVAHNCEVEVVGKITGATNTAGSEAAGTYYITKTQASAPKTESETISVGGSSGTSSAYFGNLHFTHNSDANANDIVMEFTITNKSKFGIRASIATTDEATVTGLTLKAGVTATITNNDAEISANGDETITLTISVAESADEDLADAVTGGISFNFEKYVSIMEYSEDIGWHINMGKVTSALATATGVAENTPIAWIPVLEQQADGSYTAFNGSQQANKPKTGTTYYFLSYNVLPALYNNGSIISTTNGISYNFYNNSSPYNAWYYNSSSNTMVYYQNSENNSYIAGSDYSVSNIRQYLNGEDAYRVYTSSAGSNYSTNSSMQVINFLDAYSLRHDDVYNSGQIVERTMGDLYADNNGYTAVPRRKDSNGNIICDTNTTQKLWLLSTSEFNLLSSWKQGYPIGSTSAYSWWLRTRYSNANSAYCVTTSGSINLSNVLSDNGVRPAFKIVA